MTYFFMKPNLLLGLACMGLAFFAPIVVAEAADKPKMATETPAANAAPASER